MIRSTLMAREEKTSRAAALTIGLATATVVLLFGAVPSASAADNDPIAVPDDALLACINDAVDPNRDPAETVTEEEARSITLLNCLDAGVTDVTGLENLTALTRLDLSGNDLTDVSALGEITTLENLMVNSNNIADLSPLSRLTGNVNAYGQTIELGDVIVDTAKVNPVVGLDGMPIPLIGSLYDQGANTITPITEGPRRHGWENANGQFTGNIFFRGVSEILIPDAALRTCINAEIGQGSLDRVSAPQAASITELDCSNAGVSDLTGLEAMTGLLDLRLFANDITDVTALANLSSLQRLYIYDNEIADVSALSRLSSLTLLYLASNDISDVSPLASLNSLDSLWIVNNHILDLSSLENLTGATIGATGQTVDLGQLAVNTAEDNPVIDVNGDPVPLDDLYDAGSNSFTPTATGPLDVTWSAGEDFSGTLSFTIGEGGEPEPGDGSGEESEPVPGDGSGEEGEPVPGDGSSTTGDSNTSDEEKSESDALPVTGVDSALASGGAFAAILLIAFGSLIGISRRRRV